MPKVEYTLLEAHYPRGAPLRCPECNAPIDLTTALLEDWGEPARRLGCPRCGLWLVRNARTHIKWRPLLGSVVVCLLLLLGVIVWALPVMDDVWPRSMALVFLIVAGIAAGRAIEHRTCFFVGPPLLPADGTRADVGRRAGRRA